MKDHEGQLGRIVAVADNNHDCYTVEWVLGGRPTTGILRDELVHTTAEEEGMTRRNHRKREKPADFLQYRQQEAAAAAKKEAVPKKRAAPKKKAAPVKKKATAKSATAKSAPAIKKKAATSPRKKATATKKKPTATKRKLKSAPAPRGKKQKVPPPSTTPQQSGGLDLYERHRREFERILTRLEKVDKFGYFWDDDVPDEFNECLPSSHETSGEKPKDSVDAPPPAADGNERPGAVSDGAPAASLTTKKESSTDTTTDIRNDTDGDKKPADASDGAATASLTTNMKHSTDATEIKQDKAATQPKPLFPPHPPFDWKMVRRRVELGRYVLDREKREENERFRELESYYRQLGKKRPRRRYSGKQRRPASNPRVLHPKGVDWDLFREDVVGMCNGGIERDNEGDLEAKNSLTFAANKIKEVRLPVAMPLDGKVTLIALTDCLFVSSKGNLANI